MKNNYVHQNITAQHFQRNHLIALLLMCGVLALIFLTGCQAPKIRDSVPVTTLTTDPATGAVTWSNPKDTGIKNFRHEFTRDANGVHAVVSFDSFNTMMNADVVSQTGDAQVKIITATGEANAKAIAAAGQAAGSVAGAAASTAAKGIVP
jgi:hypothetical protein